MSNIIRSGMAVIDSRKNFHAKEAKDMKPTTIVDPVYEKFYELLEDQRTKAEEKAKKEGKPVRSIPMFQLKMLSPDDDGNIKTTTLSYDMLDPNTVASFLDNIEIRLSPPKVRGGKRKAGDVDPTSTDGGNDSGASTDDQGSEAEAAEAQAKAEADKKAKAEAKAAEADKKAKVEEKAEAKVEEKAAKAAKAEEKVEAKAAKAEAREETKEAEAKAAETEPAKDESADDDDDVGALFDDD